MDKRIIGLLIIIIILSIGAGYVLLSHQDAPKQVVNNTTIANNTTVKNTTLEQITTPPSDSSDGQYGYCSICGKALTYSEAHSEYTQGKVCRNCAQNPYYQTDEGSEYANGKLAEAYPDEYGWMFEDDSSDDESGDENK